MTSAAETARAMAQLVERDGPRAAIAVLDSAALAARLERQAAQGIDPDALAAIRDEASERLSIVEDNRPTGLRDEVLSADPTPPLLPTSSEPLRGLVHLAKIATVGSARIRALADAPVNWAWRDVAVDGTITLLAGPSGGGKTTALFLLLLARATLGSPITFLGREVTPAPVGKFIVLIEGEHADGSACRKLVRSARILGVEDTALDRIILLARKAVTVGSPAWREVERMIAAGIVSDVAIDTVARCMPSDGSSEKEQVALFDAVAQAIDKAPSPEARPAVWAVAHTRKNGTTGDIDDVSGSTQRVGQADTVLLLRADKTGGRVTSTEVVFAKLREEPEQHPDPVAFSVTGGTLVIIGAPAVDDRPLETRILDRLALGPQTKSALSTALGRSRADLEEPISNLFQTRAIVSTDVKIGGRPFKAFCLRTGAE